MVRKDFKVLCKALGDAKKCIIRDAQAVSGNGLCKEKLEGWDTTVHFVITYLEDTNSNFNREVFMKDSHYEPK
jgi:hypothetical protein